VPSSSVTVVVTAHAEGPLLHPAVRSVRAAKERAEQDDVKVDVVLVLDDPDDATSRYVDEHVDDCKVVITSFRDPAAARNHGIASASGDLVALLDGDDMLGRQWLARAAAEATRCGPEFVLHPECVICFGIEFLVAYPMDARNPKYRPQALVRGNLWPLHVMAPRALFDRVPFFETPHDSGLGFEDWHWQAELAAQGVPHLVVPRTAVYYRRKVRGSRLVNHTFDKSLLPPSSLLHPDAFPFVGRPRLGGDREGR